MFFFVCFIQRVRHRGDFMWFTPSTLGIEQILYDFIPVVRRRVDFTCKMPNGLGKGRIIDLL